MFTTIWHIFSCSVVLCRFLRYTFPFSIFILSILPSLTLLYVQHWFSVMIYLYYNYKLARYISIRKCWWWHWLQVEFFSVVFNQEHVLFITTRHVLIASSLCKLTCGILYLCMTCQKRLWLSHLCWTFVGWLVVCIHVSSIVP